MVDLDELEGLWNAYMDTLNIAARGFKNEGLRRRQERNLALAILPLLQELRETREKLANWQRWTEEGIDGIRKLGRDGKFDELLPGTHGAEPTGVD